VASFALAGRLFVADLRGPGEVRELPAGEGVLEPRVDPTGTRVAWVADRALHVAELDGADPRRPAAAGR
jgi:dipeptidyl-peptidase-4